ncbi:MAG: VCBS repeat-containing protein [Bacteroidetes bacterium]|nr:VCBS repeat-containing protein [Bacteroidota bacterium]MDA1118964.1 VCBS repeat-containing protein [Bacteroidota bacterium]
MNLKFIGGIIVVFFLSIPLQVFPQAFNPIQLNGIPAVSQGAMEWGDLDNDGDYDPVISGWDGTEAISRVLINKGNSNYTVAGAGLANLYQSDLQLTDYNRDGYLDIFIMGTDRSGAFVTKIYSNNQDMTFTDLNAPLKKISRGALFVADLNQDANLDIVITGLSSELVPVTRIYHSDGLQFKDTGLRLTGLSDGDMLIEDLNSDGLADIIITGKNEFEDERFLQLTQTEDGEFKDFQKFPLGMGLNIMTLWEDIDNDGFKDLMAHRLINNEFETIFYKNESGKLSMTETGYPGVELLRYDPKSFPELFFSGENGLLRSIDIDGDATNELVQIGDLGNGESGMLVFQSTPDFSFTIDKVVIPDLGSNLPFAADWGDFDGDGDQDLLMLVWWEDHGHPHSLLFQNQGNQQFQNFGFDIPAMLGRARFIDLNNDNQPEILFGGELNESINGLTILEYTENSEIQEIVETGNDVLVQWVQIPLVCFLSNTKW